MTPELQFQLAQRVNELFVSRSDLDGLKARMLLVAALGGTRDLAILQSYFRELSGEVITPTTNDVE